MDLNLFSPNLSSYLLVITKGFFIFASFIYLIFALIVVKQVTTMSKNIVDIFNPIVVIFSYIHLAFVIFLILSLFGL